MNNTPTNSRKSKLAAVAKRAFLYATFTVFCVSLFLPATEATVSATGPANVVQAFCRYIGDFWMLAIHPTGFLAVGILLLGTFAALSFPLADLTLGKPLYLGMGIIIALCALAVFALPGELFRPLRYGSFLWIGSLVTMAISLAVLGFSYYFIEQAPP